MPTFDNKHNLIKGSSWISTGNEINGTSRYAFRRHFFQHAGFRYVESAEKVKTLYSTYETDVDVAQACEFHYGESGPCVGNFPKAYAELVVGKVANDESLKSRSIRCLEVGCSVGRGALEMARRFDSVTALDFSARFINVGVQLQSTGHVLYQISHEAEIMDFKEKTLAEFGLEKAATQCEFLQQDPSNLKAHFTGYDVVVCMNQIEKMGNPAKFLSMIHDRMNEGGLLVLGSSYDWNESVTPKANWLGGYKDAQSGENVTTFEGIQALLSEHFELSGEPESLPFMQRQTQRIHQYGESEVTVWKLISK